MLLLKKATTFNVTITCGLRERYTGPVRSLEEVYALVQKYCDENSIGVTVKSNEFIYPGGHEPGVEIGLIQYPRFPIEELAIRNHAYFIAELLMEELNQERCTIVYPDETVMVERDVA
jgi:hypothetical protein